MKAAGKMTRLASGIFLAGICMLVFTVGAAQAAESPNPETPTSSTPAVEPAVGTQPAEALGSEEPEECRDILLNRHGEESGDGEQCANNWLYAQFTEVESWNTAGNGWGSCAGVEDAINDVLGNQCVGNILSGYDEVYCIAKCDTVTGFGYEENNAKGSKVAHTYTLWFAW
jgi:hypothetical protein